MNKPAKIIISVLFITGLTALALFLLIKYDLIPFRSDKDFYIEYVGKEYRSENNRIKLGSENNEFKVNGDFESYSVSIVPNVTDETDFDYTVGSNTYRFGLTELVSVFASKPKTDENGFTVNNFVDLPPAVILSMLYQENSIDCKIDAAYTYTLSVKSDKGETVSFILENAEASDDLPDDPVSDPTDGDISKIFLVPKQLIF